MEYVLSTSKNSEKSEGTIFIWDLKTGTVLETFNKNSCEVNSAAFLPHQAIMTAQATNSSLFYWNWVKVCWI